MWLSTHDFRELENIFLNLGVLLGADGFHWVWTSEQRTQLRNMADDRRRNRGSLMQPFALVTYGQAHNTELRFGGRLTWISYHPSSSIPQTPM
jgi:hypothetical protein